MSQDKLTDGMDLEDTHLAVMFDQDRGPRGAVKLVKAPDESTALAFGRGAEYVNDRHLSFKGVLDGEKLASSLNVESGLSFIKEGGIQIVPQQDPRAIRENEVYFGSIRSWDSDVNPVSLGSELEYEISPNTPDGTTLYLGDVNGIPDDHPAAQQVAIIVSEEDYLALEWHTDATDEEVSDRAVQDFFDEHRETLEDAFKNPDDVNLMNVDPDAEAGPQVGSGSVSP